MRMLPLFPWRSLQPCAQHFAAKLGVLEHESPWVDFFPSEQCHCASSERGSCQEIQPGRGVSRGHRAGPAWFPSGAGDGS